MKKWLCNSVRVGVLTATCFGTLAFADTGSERLDGQVAQLQRQIGARQHLEDDLNRDALALGYSVPEISINSNETVVAKADDDAFMMAMNHLQRTMTMFAMAD